MDPRLRGTTGWLSGLADEFIGAPLARRRFNGLFPPAFAGRQDREEYGPVLTVTGTLTIVATTSPTPRHHRFTPFQTRAIRNVQFPVGILITIERRLSKKASII